MNLHAGGVTTYLGLTAAGTTPQLRINATTGLNNMISFNSTAASALVIGNQVAGLPDGQFGVSTDAGATASLRVATSGIVVPGHIRDALVPSTLDISGGNISNSGTTRSANFLAVPGGASRPGYAFTTDPSSGIDLPGTSQIAFETAGVQRMVISNANVGIGTTAPAFALDVSGVTNVQTAGAGGTLNVGGTSGLFMFCDAVTTKHGYIRALGSTANLYLGTSNTNHMVITNAGRVGIGTGDPQFALDVSGSVQASGGLLVTDTNASRVNNVNLYANSSQAVVEAYKRDLTLWDDLVFRTANNTTNATRMTITGSNGNVGIGTTNPGQTLVVNGTAAATQFNVGDGTVGAPSLTFTGETTTGFYRAAATDVRYATGGVDRLYFAGTRLGVGVVPTVALDVQGTVRGRAGVVFTSGGVGYLRDTLNSPSVDISNGNISNAGTTTSLTFVGNGTIPVGGIIMWSGTIAAIPTGWALCDGNNGTPNLVNRFVMAAGNLYGVGAFGGATSNRLTPMNIPPHKHTIPQSYNADEGSGSTITYVGMGQPPQVSPANASIYGADNVLQTAQGNNPEQFSILNPYYALAYIMRTT
jgi:hypothetical protein